jgi:hypothetical protein
MPSTSAEFAQQVLAGLPRSERPGSAGETSTGQTPQPTEPATCHSAAVAQAFRPEEPASSSNSSLATHHSPLTTRHSPLATSSIPRTTRSSALLEWGSSAPYPSPPPSRPAIDGKLF